MQRLPSKVHWRIRLEMADLAKRENKFPLARTNFRMVTQLQPYAAQGWLEFSRMEDECGNLQRCQSILRQGLEFCPYNEVCVCVSRVVDTGGVLCVWCVRLWAARVRMAFACVRARALPLSYVAVLCTMYECDRNGRGRVCMCSAACPGRRCVVEYRPCVTSLCIVPVVVAEWAGGF